jgi:type IV secretion system protein VirD4
MSRVMASGHGLHMGHFFNKERNAFGAERRLYEGDRHAILFGPTRSGKFTRLLAVNLLSDCLDDRSVVVIDPKGEAAAVTAWHRHQLGHDVKIIDPFGGLHEAVKNSPKHQEMIAAGLTRGVGFNPLDMLDPGTAGAPESGFFDEAAKLGDALIKVEPGERDKHWPESARALAIGFLMWEKLWKKDAANLEDVRMMLTAPNLGAVVEKIMEYAGKDEFAGLGGIQIKSLLARFLQSTNEMAAIRSAADTQTQWMLSRPIADNFKLKTRIDFRELRKRPTTVYVILPGDYLKTHAVWLRLVLVSALRSLYRPGGVRVTMIIDELAALGHLGVLEDAFGLVGGYAIQLMGILQDIPQLKDLYDKRWQSFLANAGVIQFFAPNDPETAKWMSERAGKATAWSKSVGESTAAQTARDSENWNQVSVDRIRSHELFGLAPGVGLAWLAGLSDTVMFKAPNYWELRRCTARALPNPYSPR